MTTMSPTMKDSKNKASNALDANRTVATHYQRNDNVFLCTILPSSDDGKDCFSDDDENQCHQPPYFIKVLETKVKNDTTLCGRNPKGILLRDTINPLVYLS